MADILLNPGLKMAASTDVMRRTHYIRAVVGGRHGGLGGDVMEVTQ